MKKKFVYVAVAAMALTGCVNSDYDFSDIDTTTRISVNDLTVPLQVSTIKLDDMLDLGDGSEVKKSNSGEYYFLVDGELNTDPVSIPEFTAKGFATTGKTSFDFTSSSPAKSMTRSGSQLFAQANIPLQSAELNFSTDAGVVDDAIVEIGKIGLETTLNLSLRFSGLENTVSHIHIKDLKLKLIDGLDATIRVKGDKWYDCRFKDGIVEVPDCQTSDNYTLELEAHVTGVDAEKANITLKNGEFVFNNEPAVLGGRLEAMVEDLKGDVLAIDIPKGVTFYLEAKATDITIKEFSGRVKYDLSSGLNIDPISLADLPDVLTQSGTNIELENPQIYLSVNNPIIEKGYSLWGQLGLAFAVNGETTNKCSTAADGIKINKAQNDFCLSPVKPESFFQKGNNTVNYEYVPFPGLGKILSNEVGGGIPRSITVKILDPKVPEQDVVGFRLGEQLNSVHGSWTFMAPLSLTTNSHIKYVKEWDDWDSKDLKDLTVNHAAISADLISDVAVALEVDVTLLGHNGQLKGTATLQPGETHFAFDLAGQPLNRIYGAQVEVRAAGTGKALGPNQSISISNLKAKFDGYYETEF